MEFIRAKIKHVLHKIFTFKSPDPKIDIVNIDASWGGGVMNIKRSEKEVKAIVHKIATSISFREEDLKGKGYKSKAQAEFIRRSSRKALAEVNAQI